MAYLIAGLDEVGRGALAGPLVAVAAMFRMETQDSMFSMDDQVSPHWNRERSPIPRIHDSKTFKTHAKRVEMFDQILRSPYLEDFGIGYVTVKEINEIGIDMANRYAFFYAVKDLRSSPRYLLVDGDKPAPDFCRSQQSYRPKADSLWWPVGAASILAKVIRDNLMAELGTDFPHYGWSDNAGYGTQTHVDAIKLHGVCGLHRSQFVRNIVGGRFHEQDAGASTPVPTGGSGVSF